MLRRSHTLNYGHKGRGSRSHDRTVRRIAKRRENRQWQGDARRDG
ncbi:hypothetical protein ACWD3I_25055 [Streptomyces sp. NPDC002817]